jgi:two-component system sensor histidine kinase BarA
MKIFSTGPRHITSQILLAVLIPVAIVTTLIIAYFSWDRYRDIEKAERQLGELSTSYLAQAAELAVYAGNRNQLRELARIALQRPAVARVCFLDSNASELIREGQVLQPECTENTDSQQLSVKQYADSIQISRPIRPAPLFITDIEVESDSKAIGWVVLSLDNAVMASRVRQMLVSAAMLAWAGLLTGVLFALRAGARIGGPVRALTQHVEQLDSKAPTVLFPPEGNEETITLSNGINRLAQSVNTQMRQQQQRIDSATAKLVRRNRQLEETREVLEQALQTKSDFLARMSHELRTPLTTIIGFNRLLAQTGNPSQIEQYSRHIEHASILLRSIIEDILDYSRLQSAAVELEAIAFNLHDCLEDVIGLHGYESIAKNIELVLLLDHDVPQLVIGDPQRLKQIVNNLLANAIKFTDRGDVIVQLAVVTATADSVLLQCSVKDTGIGIGADQHHHLFQPFTQADNSITRKYGGTGLGLTICESLVQLMGGEISLSSTPGKGTTVVFSFSVKPGTAAQASSPTVAPGNQSLLGYEGNPWSRRALRTALLEWSHNVSICRDSASLLNRLGKSRPDLLLLSLSQAEAAKPVLMRQIRSLYSGPILLLSSAPDLAQRIKDCGIPVADIDFALKPLRRQSLVSQCRSLVSATPEIIQSQQPGAGPLDGLQLLVAEDQSPIRELLVSLLAGQGAQVTAVADGQQAIDACAKIDYDLLLIDLHMPRMDGLTVIDLLQYNGYRAPVICLTADVTAAERQALSWAGASAILLKPIDETALLRNICELCQRSTPQPNAEAQNIDLPPELLPELAQQLLLALQRGRESLRSGDEERLHRALHDMLGLAGMFQEKLLFELVKEIAAQVQHLSPEDAEHLFTEAELLIRKY